MSHKKKKENNSVKQQHYHCKLWYAFTIASEVAKQEINR
jgi:hypothetical protein